MTNRRAAAFQDGGVGVPWGQKTVNGGTSDEDVRVQVSARYSFGITL